MPKRAGTFKVLAMLACALCVAASMALSGCLGLSKKVYTAATVDGVAIEEDDVTAYIEGFRSENEARETDAGWAEYLSSNGYTSESFRTYVLNTVFIPDLVVKLNADNKGIAVTDDELDRIITAEKIRYEELYGPDSWTSVLSSYGYDEATWRESEMNRLLRDRLEDEVVDDVEPSRAQVVEYAEQVAPNYNGKHSYYILLDNEDNAAEVLDHMGGQGASMTLAAFKKSGRRAARLYGTSVTVQEGQEAEVISTGLKYAGWSSFDSFGTNTAYNNALNDVDLGTVSGVVQLTDASWAIIYCDDVYVFQKDDLNKTEAIPSAIYAKIVEGVRDLLRQEKFDKWIDKAQEKAAVEINSMPAGLPYDVSHI